MIKESDAIVVWMDICCDKCMSVLVYQGQLSTGKHIYACKSPGCSEKDLIVQHDIKYPCAEPRKKMDEPAIQHPTGQGSVQQESE